MMSQTKVFAGWVGKKPTEQRVKYSVVLFHSEKENAEYLFVMRGMLDIILNLQYMSVKMRERLWKVYIKSLIGTWLGS